MAYCTPDIYPQPHNKMDNEAPYNEQNNSTEHMDRSNIPNDDVLTKKVVKIRPLLITTMMAMTEKVGIDRKWAPVVLQLIL